MHLMILRNINEIKHNEQHKSQIQTQKIYMDHSGVLQHVLFRFYTDIEKIR